MKARAAADTLAADAAPEPEALRRAWHALTARTPLRIRDAQAWLVKKPTAYGIVTSIELYDAAGEAIACFFGRRKPGIAESTDWRALAHSLAPR